jgi:hypothetical protein
MLRSTIENALIPVKAAWTDCRFHDHRDPKAQEPGPTLAKEAQVLLEKWQNRGGDTSATRSSRRSVDVSPSARPSGRPKARGVPPDNQGRAFVRPRPAFCMLYSTYLPLT